MLWFNFILGLNFIFLCFRLISIHYHTPKQREIKFEPRIKLNHNIYNLCSTWWWTSLWTSMLRSIGRCQKGHPLTSVTWLKRSFKWTTRWCDVFFFKLSADLLLVLIDCRLRSTMKRPYKKYLINIVHLVITGKSQTLVWDFPVMTSLSVNKKYIIINNLFCAYIMIMNWVWLIGTFSIRFFMGNGKPQNVTWPRHCGPVCSLQFTFEPQEGLPVVSDLRQGFLPQKIVQPRV